MDRCTGRFSINEIFLKMVLTLSQTTIFFFYFLKLKELTVDNFKFENGRKFSKRVENTGKRRNCSLRAISPFPPGFSNDLYCSHIKTGKGLNTIKSINRSLPQTEPVTPYILILTHQQQTAFENIVGKEEIARYEQFLLFPQCFLLNQKTVYPFVNNFDIISLFADELEEPKIGM